MRLLVLEDEPALRETLSQQFRAAGFAIDAAADGVEGEFAGLEYPIDVAVVDLGLPGRSGLDAIRAWSKAGKSFQVLILTARDSWQEKVTGLDAGADDYVVKPFDLKELEARLRAVLRRRAGSASRVIEHGRLSLDLASHELRRDGVPVPVSPPEFALLHAHPERPVRNLSRAQLEERLYGWGEEVGSNVVEVHIHSLRRKPGADLIRNVRGVG